jgi:predicted O-methyltransferase YrrM
MKFSEISSKLSKVPFVTKRNAHFLYHLVAEKKLTNVLELGIAHGTATCYIAAALQELGTGSVTAVDLVATKDTYKPSAEEQLQTTGLSGFAKVIRMQTGYTWFLHDEIVRNTRNNVCDEVYDLCIIDGPKNWTIDGAAFFLTDKLLKKNGWIIFDDYKWTYASASQRRDSTDGITHRLLSKQEQEIPHIQEVFELLVKQHPNYGDLMLLDDDDWAIARKTISDNKLYTIDYRETTTDMCVRLMKTVYIKLKSLRNS